MTLLSMLNPTGEIPRQLPAKLPNNAAQYAQDCDFLSGDLRGIREIAAAGLAAAGVKSFYFPSSSELAWFSWPRDVDAVRSPVVNDAYDRFYWTDGSQMYVSREDVGGSGGEPSDGNKAIVGVPVPAAAPSIAASQMTLADVVSYTFQVSDELNDGTLANTIDVSPVQSGTATSLSFDFTAREPQVTGGGTSATTATTWPATAFPLQNAEEHYGLSQSPRSSRKVLFYFDYTSDRLYAYYTDPVLAPPADVICEQEGSGDSLVGFSLSRLGDSLWYSDPKNPIPYAAAETAVSTSTTVTLPYKGPVVTVTMTQSDETVLTANIRTDSNKTTWPPELPGCSASLTIDGTNWKVSIGSTAGDVDSRAYIYTYVNQQGQEGAPSDPAFVEVSSSAHVSIGYTAPPTGYVPITLVRLYRTATGQSTAFLLVKEWPVSSGLTIVDDVAGSMLGESLQTLGFRPPTPGLKGLCAMANGVLAAFMGNEVHFCQPYLPYAWVLRNVQTFPGKVIGICPTEGGLYVTTTSNPFLVSGVNPDAMTSNRLPSVQAGVSKWSICDAGQYVVWASNDGLAMARGVDVSLDTSFKFFTRNEWRDRFGTKLAQMHINVHDGNLLIWFADGTPGILIRLEEEAGSLTRLTDTIMASFVNPLSDSVTISNGSTAGVFKGSSSTRGFVWWSKDFILPIPENMGVIQAVGAGHLTVEVYADGALWQTISLTLATHDRVIARLKSGIRARRWSFKLTGTSDTTLSEFYVANTPAELQGV